MQTRNYDISIIIVTYNNRDILPRCLVSLSRVTAAFSSQLCIIDNDSADGTARYLQDPLSWNPMAFTAVETIYNATNLGYTKGVNQGLQRALGRMILLLNPDIVFADNPFERLFDELQKDARIGVVAPQLRFFNGDIQPSCRRFPKKADVLFEFMGLSRIFAKSALFNAWRMADFSHTVSSDVPQPQGAFLLLRRDVLLAVGPLDESFPMFFSDVDWCYRVYAQGWRIRFVADVFVYHLQGASIRQKKARMIISSHRSFITFFQKYDKTWRDRCSTKCIFLLLLIATPLRLLRHLNRIGQ
ncbi:glycosyltransferase family 2 protein [candidate division KSB1 bacterium]|nr:glycosyltransferase family 2 protein [candidate division KSB1 bacterium]RQW07258.1 MAG: glycosyltransferase family 2 protein [candidate division KSB1 bacterium]